MKTIKDKRDTLLGNLDIVGLMLIAIATVIIKQRSLGLYMLVEAIGASFIFAKIYVDFRLAETNYDKTFYGLALLGILVVCLSIFQW